MSITWANQLYLQGLSLLNRLQQLDTDPTTHGALLLSTNGSNVIMAFNQFQSKWVLTVTQAASSCCGLLLNSLVTSSLSEQLRSTMKLNIASHTLQSCRCSRARSAIKRPISEQVDL